MQRGEQWVDKPYFLVRDQGERERHNQADQAQLSLHRSLRVVGEERLLSHCAVQTDQRKWKRRGQKERISLEDVVVPVILAVEHCQRLRDIEVEELEWWEGPGSVEEAIQRRRKGENDRPENA